MKKVKLGQEIIVLHKLVREKQGIHRKNFYKDALRLIEDNKLKNSEIKQFGYAKNELEKKHPILF
jgi:hypothetical protein